MNQFKTNFHFYKVETKCGETVGEYYARNSIHAARLGREEYADLGLDHVQAEDFIATRQR